MDQLRRQVMRARRRLMFEQFLSVLGWSLLVTLTVAAIMLAIPKFWILAVAPDAWTWSCVAAGILSGLCMAVLATLCVRRSAMDAAIEIDRRYGLRERVSSSLALPPEEAQTDIGRALIDDAARRVNTIDVRDEFHVRPPWTVALPVIPALLIFVLVVFFDNATPKSQAKASSEEQKVVKRETEKLQEQLAKQRKQLSEQQLKEAEQLLEQLQQAVDDLQKSDDVDRKKAMIKINEMAKMIEQQRDQLRGSQEIQKQLDKLKDIQQGPGDKLAQALQQGDFKSAIEQLEELKEQISKGELNDKQREQLTKQLSEMQQKLQQTQEAYEQAKRDLEQQVKQAEREGNMNAVNDLQNKLDKMQQAQPQMDRLAQMAESLSQCAECLNNGDASQAASQLDQLSQNLQQMQNELAQLETLDELLDQLGDYKDGLNGDGEMGGEALSMQPSLGQGFSLQTGQGLGDGRGVGDRPEDATDTQSYESKVNSQLHNGPSVVTGTIQGPNIGGQSREAVKDTILSTMRTPTDPLADEQLPHDQREHAKEYFQRFLPKPSSNE